jgi:signal transduction histidine kinase/ActR/RegA family two-component response regulator
MNATAQKWKYGVFIVLLSFFIGILDWLTGYDLSFFVFYFIPVSLAAWFIGKSGSFLISVLCAMVWLGADVLTGHRYSSTFTNVWDPSIRLISYLAIGLAVSKLKQTLEIEKETTRRLRASIVERGKSEEALRELTTSLEQRVAERTRMVEARAKQLQTLAMELIESEERERRRFSELLHDDLQQLLSAILLQLDAGGGNLPNRSQVEYAQRLLRESISKTRNLSHELSPAVLRHSGLIGGLQWLAGQMNAKFGLKVQLEANSAQSFDDSPVQVFIYRTVQELLFNVVKHAGVKEAHVVLSSTNSDVRVAVSDQGQGFDPDSLDKIAEKAGFGLLSIRERIRYMGGGLEIDSAPGRGSRFMLKIPMGLENVKQSQPLGSTAYQQPQTLAGHMDTASGRGKRVLIADDHRIMRQGLVNLIAGQPNIQVVGEAADGQQALELVEKLHPDVVVMDVSMPVMDGVEATRRIKAELPEVRVIGLSMHEDEHITKSMHEAGAEAFVSKAASWAELLKAIYGGFVAKHNT